MKLLGKAGGLKGLQRLCSPVGNEPEFVDEFHTHLRFFLHQGVGPVQGVMENGPLRVAIFQRFQLRLIFPQQPPLLRVIQKGVLLDQSGCRAIKA